MILLHIQARSVGQKIREFSFNSSVGALWKRKSLRPIFTNKDIARISKAFRIKTRQFIDTYLNVDADQDYVLKSSPCTFLADDNTCNIYDIRPKACQEYPHTNRKSFEKISDLTIQNLSICPATFNIVEALMAKLK